MTEWIDLNDELPMLSYIESDDLDDKYDANPVLVLSKNRENMLVAWLEKNQDEESWDFEELFWSVFIAGEACDIIRLDFDTFSHWMPLPKLPKDEK